jgi:hypothetical protein
MKSVMFSSFKAAPLQWLYKKKESYHPAKEPRSSTDKQIDYYEKDMSRSLDQFGVIHSTFQGDGKSKKQLLTTMKLKTYMINAELSLLHLEKKKEKQAAKLGRELYPHEKKTLTLQKMTYFIDQFQDGVWRMDKLKEDIAQQKLEENTGGQEGIDVKI